VIFASRSDGSIPNVSSISTSTGIAPVRTTALTVATQRKPGIKTSCPGPTPSAASAVERADVPLATACAYFRPINCANSRSSEATSEGGSGP